MRGEIGLVQRQPRAEKTQALKLSEPAERLFQAAVDGKRKRGLISEQPEEDQVSFVDKAPDLRVLEQHRVRRFTADQAKVTPYGNEARFLASERVSKPIRILAALAAAIDKRASKYVVVFQVW